MIEAASRCITRRCCSVRTVHIIMKNVFHFVDTAKRGRSFVFRPHAKDAQRSAPKGSRPRAATPRRLGEAHKAHKERARHLKRAVVRPQAFRASCGRSTCTNCCGQPSLQKK
eukprot:6213019-Pleurochrysis_carterae.AAC.2